MSDHVVNLKLYAKRKAESRGEEQDAPLRSERFFKLADDWYFTTREGVTMGPFGSHDLAKAAVSDFISFISSASPKIVQAFTGEEKQQAGAVRT